MVARRGPQVEGLGEPAPWEGVHSPRSGSKPMVTSLRVHSHSEVEKNQIAWVLNDSLHHGEPLK